MPDQKTALVISAHAADFVWRCGGAIVLHAGLGYQVTVVCLSFGERGGSAKLWKQADITLERVKAARCAEAERAAAALGVHDLVSFDLGDYPLRLTDEDKSEDAGTGPPRTRPCFLHRVEPLSARATNRRRGRA
jgi:4-oxalomesaconate hydratase